MTLDELAPTVRQLTSDLHELSFTCPTCRKNRIQITVRIGAPKNDPPHAWGADSLDTATMTLSPSVSNTYHGRTRCNSHIEIRSGVVLPR